MTGFIRDMFPEQDQLTTKIIIFINYHNKRNKTDIK